MPSLFKKILHYWLPALVWAGLIFFLSSIPGLKSDLPGVYDFILRKIAHAFEFGILAWLLVRLFYAGHKKTLILSLLLAGVLSFLYAVSDEWHQAFVPNREASIWDATIDTIGVITSILLLSRIYRNISLYKPTNNL